MYKIPLTFALAVSLLGGYSTQAAPPGFDVTTTTFSNVPGNFFGAGALAYAPNGTLYVAEARDFLTGPSQSTIRVILPDGTEAAPLIIQGAGSTFLPGGMAFNSTNNRLIISDNAPGANTIYSIDTLTGNQQILLPVNTFSAVDDIAVRSTGEIFISNAPFAFNQGTVSLFDPIAGTATPVVTGLDLAAGLDFDPAGNLVIQHATNATEDFNDPLNLADVFRLPINDSGPTLAFGTLETLATGIPNAAFDLAVDADGDIFLTGGDFTQPDAGGLFQLDRDASGAFLGTATLFDGPLFFAAELDVLFGSNPFEPSSGPHAGVLSYIPGFNSSGVTNITPTANIVNSVPEPTSLLSMLICATAALAAYRLTRGSAVIPLARAG